MLHSHYIENSLLFKGFIVKNFVECDNNTFEASIELPVIAHICPHCGTSTTKIKDYRIQKTKDLDLLGKKLYLFIRKRRYLCPCCHKSFTENNPLINRYQHFTDRFYKHVYKEFQTIQSFTSIANRIGVSVTSVIRWFDNISYPHPQLPECFCIDEFKGNTGNEKFQCNVSEPLSRQVIDILPSRNVDSLCKHFRRYALEERRKVKYVVMDLSSIFRATVKTLFPDAEIVADKFHVMRLVSWSMEAVRKRIQKQFRKERRRWFKRSKNILLKPEYKLSLEDRSVLNRMLLASPELEKAYILKEEFYKVFGAKTVSEGKKSLQNWLLLASQFKLKEFNHCITTFTKWSREIINVIEHRYTNGYVEGVNNKIKVLKRISFGVRNFERFRNRILHLCS